MRNASDKMSKKQAKEALLRSGYLLESRLDTVLRDKGYYVDANTAYPDPYTGKSRELDLCAMRAFRAGPAEDDSVFVVLLIECVNNPQPIAFITKEPQLEFLQYHEVKLAGLPVKIPVEGEQYSSESLLSFLDMHRYHHYCKGRIATQFCSFSKKKSGEWLAFHEEKHFDSFRKLSAVVEHYVDERFKSWFFGCPETVNIDFYYPVLVLQGELFDARSTKSSLRLFKADHVQYHLSAFVKAKANVYQIDVVAEDFFPRYLAIVEQELSTIARLLRHRHVVVRNAIDKIARSTKRLRSPEKIRAAMEF